MTAVNHYQIGDASIFSPEFAILARWLLASLLTLDVTLTFIALPCSKQEQESSMNLFTSKNVFAILLLGHSFETAGAQTGFNAFAQKIQKGVDPPLLIVAATASAPLLQCVPKATTPAPPVTGGTGNR